MGGTLILPAVPGRQPLVASMSRAVPRWHLGKCCCTSSPSSGNSFYRFFSFPRLVLFRGGSTLPLRHQFRLSEEAHPVRATT